jgi:chromosomal replication initiator protein
MNAEQAWQSAVGQLQMEMPRAAFIAYVRETKLVSYEMGWFCIEAASEFARDWLTARLTSTVTRMLTGMMNRAVQVVFVVKKEAEKQATKNKNDDPQPDLFKKEGRHERN